MVFWSRKSQRVNFRKTLNHEKKWSKFLGQYSPLSKSLLVLNVPLFNQLLHLPRTRLHLSLIDQLHFLQLFRLDLLLPLGPPVKPVIHTFMLIKYETNPRRVHPIRVLQRRRGMHFMLRTLQNDGPMRQSDRHATHGGVFEAVLIIRGGLVHFRDDFRLWRRHKTGRRWSRDWSALWRDEIHVHVHIHPEWGGLSASGEVELMRRLTPRGGRADRRLARNHAWRGRRWDVVLMMIRRVLVMVRHVIGRL